MKAICRCSFKRGVLLLLMCVVALIAALCPGIVLAADSAALPEALTVSDQIRTDLQMGRLVVRGMAADDVRPGDRIVSDDGAGTYLISTQDVQRALEYYGVVGTFAARDGVFCVADEQNDSSAGKDAPPSGCLKPLEDTVSCIPAGTIAVIDTGADPQDASLLGRYSAIGDDGVDRNGHGSAMIGAIRAVHPRAQLISIKAAGDDGSASASAVYAAVVQARDMGCAYINLSLSAWADESNEIVRQAILDAIAHGVVVVGAAGNEGRDAHSFIPGGVPEAIVAGSLDEAGIIMPSSNCGDTVDVYIESEYTSYASARLCALVSWLDWGLQDVDFAALLEAAKDNPDIGVCALSAEAYGSAYGGDDAHLEDPDTGMFRIAADPYTGLANRTRFCLENYAFDPNTSTGHGRKGVLLDKGLNAVCIANTEAAYSTSYQWKATAISSEDNNLFRIRNIASGRYLAVSGSNVITAAYNSTSKAQQWYVGVVIKNTTDTNQIYVLRPASATSKSMRCASASNGIAVTVAGNADGNNLFRWRIPGCGYYLAYNGNGATLGSMGTETKTNLDAVYTLSPNAYSRTGYTFAGWNTKADGTGGNIANGASIKGSDYTSVRLDTVTLYARWNPLAYKQVVQVRYENADGTFTGYTNVVDGDRNYDSTVSWSRAADAAYKAASISYKVSGAATKQLSVYRNTAINTIRARFQNADGTWGAYQTVSTGTDRVGAVRSWTYAADGTYLAASGRLTGTSSSQTVSVDVPRASCRLCVKASYLGQLYDSCVAFGTFGVRVNGEQIAAGVMAFDEEVLVGSAFEIVGITVRSGFALAADQNDEELSGTAGKQGTVAILPYRDAAYRIVFHGNGASSGLVPIVDAGYRDAITLPAEGYELAGCSLAGWNTDPAGHGEGYSVNQEVTGLSGKDGDIVDLYAQWDHLPLMFSVPTRVDYLMQANGMLSGPADDVVTVENLSAFPIGITGMQVDAAEGYTVVPIRSRTGAAGEFSFTFTLDGDATTYDLGDYANADQRRSPQDVGAFLERIEPGSSCSLNSLQGKGSMRARDMLAADGRVASITWRIAARD